MSHRISHDNWGKRKLHFESGQYLLRLCADLKIQLDNKQPLRADESRLMEWSTHRKDLEKCEEPIVRFYQYGQFPEGFMPKHDQLLIAAGILISELRLRNVGQGLDEITWQQLEDISIMVMRLDCYERLVFY